MKRLLKTIFTLICVFLLGIPSVKSQNDDGKAILYFLSKDSVSQEIYGYFYRTQGKLFHDPAVPRFIMASRNNNLILGMGGYVMLRASYDFRGTCDGLDFLSYDIPVPNAGNPKKQLQMSAASSRLFLKLIANTKALGQILTYVEGDFLGASRTLRLRHAYIRFLGFTFGQTTSTFIDTYSFAPTIDQNGSPIASYQRNPLIRYERTFGNHFKAGLSAEMPPYTGTYLNNTERANATTPDFPFYVKYMTGQNHIQLTGILRNLPYKNLTTEKYKSVFGVGGKISGSLCILPNLQTMFYAMYGKGITAYSLELAGEGVDLLPNYQVSGKMFAPKLAAYYAGVKLTYTPKLYSGFTYSYVRLYTRDSFTSATEFDGSTFYKYGQAASGNLLWNFIPNAICGVEYWWGQRTNYDGSLGHANRIYGMIRYNF